MFHHDDKDMRGISILSIIILLCATISTFAEKAENETFQIIGNLSFDPITESSGLVKSRQWDNVYWTHNDSGDKARIFAVTQTGSIIYPDWLKEPFEGVNIPDAANIDWEDIATDNEGNLYIAACGNNSNARRDLAIIMLREPNPKANLATRTFHTFRFEWPDQKSFDQKLLNFDCESIFHANGKLYLLTKHRSDTQTKLYRFDHLDPIGLNVPTLISKIEIGGMVTGADVTPDGERLAVITYHGLWVFDKPSDGSDNYFAGKAYFGSTDLQTKTIEAVTFEDPETLILTNEERDIYQVKLSDLEQKR